jgi:CBS domain-containing protein
MARRQIANRVGDLPARTVPAVPEHLTMAAARKIAALKRVGLLFVEREGRLVGIIDERVLAEAADDTAVGAVMGPVGTCLHPAMAIARARDLFSLSGQSMLPVSAGVFLLGAVTRAEVEQALAHAREGSRKRAPRFRAAA